MRSTWATLRATTYTKNEYRKNKERERAIMGHRKFTDIVGDLSPERRERIEAIKNEARADTIAFNLAQLRRHRRLTQSELAQTLERTQASISAMESADDNRLSTWRNVIEAMGGRLELVAVFDNERIALPDPETINAPS